MNYYNTHIWADASPHAIYWSYFHHRFSVNLWVGLLGNKLIGLFKFPRHLAGNADYNFLKHDLPGLTKEIYDVIPLDVRVNLWFFHDGAPPHFHVRVRRFLDNTFPGRWIRRSGPVVWPVQSPGLNSLDFYFWSHLKTLVYDVEITSERHLYQRIFREAQSIREDPIVLEGNANWLRRAQICVWVSSGHFEHLL
ncbi:hypothetical protein BDFB_007611 [Asbolus verrucosus]|uniref:DDE 3 domain containing protein n=1 Tax=Asbolus verrucosus TaxID=1661398 RepID=A0A482W982_ASBVE|nr:hypothetical protein BDFB_007611 [Asbolus verrucosus]